MKATEQPNFLPEDYLRKKAAQRATQLCVGLLAVTMVGIGVGFLVANRTLSDLKTQDSILSEQLRVEADRIKRFEEVRKKQGELTQQISVTGALIERVRRSIVLADLTNTRPVGVSLTTFALDTKTRLVTPPAQKKTLLDQKKEAAAAAAKPPAPVKVNEVTLKLSGVAYTDIQVAEYIGNLSKSPLFSDVNLVISENTLFNQETMRKFEVEMVLNTDAPTTALASLSSDGGVQ